MLNRRVTTTTLRTIFDLLDKAGGTIPPEVTAAHHELLHAAAKAHELNTRSDLAGAVLDALLNDRDPASDPDVQRHATLRAIDSIASGIDTAINQRISEFLTEHAETLLAGFTEPVDRAAATITTALAKLGPVDLRDTAKIITQGGTVARTWGDATAATTTIGHAQTAWHNLAGLGAIRRVRQGTALLIIADVPPAAWFDNHHDTDNSDHLTAWDAARLGYPLEFATPETYTERLEALEAEATRRRDVVEQASRAIPNQWRSGAPNLPKPAA